MKRLLPMTTAVLLMLCITNTSAATTGTSNFHIQLPVGWVTNALCVHSFEGSWTDPNAPYYGGMQMDVGFQQTYGLWAYNRWGTADHWPIWAQLQVSYKAWKSRGWWPWPNTARYCHLI